MTCFIIYKSSIYCTSGEFEESEDCEPQPFSSFGAARGQINQLKDDGFRFDRMPHIVDANASLHGYSWSLQINKYIKSKLEALIDEAIGNAWANEEDFDDMTTLEVCEDLARNCSSLDKYLIADMVPHVNRALGRRAECN